MPPSPPSSRITRRRVRESARSGFVTPIQSRPAVAPGEDFDARRVLQRTGFRLRDEYGAAGDDLAKIGGALGRLGSGQGIGLSGFAISFLAGIFGLVLLDLLLSARGSRITAAAIKWSGGSLARLVNPTDPLIGRGSSSAASPAPSSTPPAGAGQSSGAAAGDSPQRAARPAGRLVPVPGAPGRRVDAAYSGLVAWITAHFGVTVTSAYRTRAQNNAAGGASNSDHLRGLAVDFGGSAAALQRLYRWAIAVGFPYVESPAQAVAAGEGPHVHISFYRP